VLSRLTEEEGLIYLLELWLPTCGNIQRSWLESGEPVFHLEDCMTDPSGTLKHMFESGLGLLVENQRLEQVIARYSFENLSGGRERGQVPKHITAKVFMATGETILLRRSHAASKRFMAPC
jgi:hypothetical protein